MKTNKISGVIYRNLIKKTHLHLTKYDTLDCRFYNDLIEFVQRVVIPNAVNNVQLVYVFFFYIFN